jgi:hypothetical protein
MLNCLSANSVSVKDASAASFSNHFSSANKNDLNLILPKARDIQLRATQTERAQLFADIIELRAIIREQRNRCRKPWTKTEYFNEK